MATPQLVDDLRARVVLEAPQVLEAQRPDRLDLLFVQMGPEHDVGEDLQRRLEVAAQGRRRHRRVKRLGTLRMADAQVVQRREELPAVALARPAGDPLRRHRRRAAAQVQAARTLVGHPRRHEHGECRRLHLRHRLGEQHQSVRINMLLNYGWNRVGHGHLGQQGRLGPPSLVESTVSSHRRRRNLIPRGGCRGIRPVRDP